MISLPVKQRESYTNRRTVGHKQSYASTVPDDSRDPGFNWAPGGVKRKGEGSRERGGGGGAEILPLMLLSWGELSKYLSFLQ